MCFPSERPHFCTLSSDSVPTFFFPLCMGIYFFFFLLQQLLCLRLIEDFLTANVVGIESHEYGRTTKKIGDGGAGAGLWMTEGLQKM